METNSFFQSFLLLLLNCNRIQTTFIITSRSPEVLLIAHCSMPHAQASTPSTPPHKTLSGAGTLPTRIKAKPVTAMASLADGNGLEACNEACSEKIDAKIRPTADADTPGTALW